MSSHDRAVNGFIQDYNRKWCRFGSAWLEQTEDTFRIIHDLGVYIMPPTIERVEIAVTHAIRFLLMYESVIDPKVEDHQTFLSRIEISFTPSKCGCVDINAIEILRQEILRVKNPTNPEIYARYREFPNRLESADFPFDPVELKMCDLLFLVGGKEQFAIPAHRKILTKRGNLFWAKTLPGFQEGGSIIDLPEKSLGPFLHLLKAIYKGEYPSSLHDLLALRECAKRYKEEEISREAETLASTWLENKSFSELNSIN